MRILQLYENSMNYKLLRSGYMSMHILLTLSSLCFQCESAVLLHTSEMQKIEKYIERYGK